MLEIMQPDAFDQVFSIMERSFPEDEYRPYEEQKKLLDGSGYCIYVSRSRESGDVEAFLAVWQFADFTYIEHFAADPAIRGRGLGSAILQEARQMFPKQLCLEVEPPETELAKRRIAFYERNGFFLNAYPYIQPPISTGRQELPLMVMTSGAGISEEMFEKIRGVLYREVYKQDEFQQAVLLAGEPDVRGFLVQILREDARLFARFKLFAGKGCMSGADMDRYKGQVDAVICKYVEKEGRVSYQQAFELMREMEEFLSSDVRMMLEDKHFAQAFALACHIFTETGNLDMDDSAGIKGTVGAQCVQIWKEIAGQADRPLQRQMFAWFTGHMDGSVPDYMEEYMEQVLMEAFDGQEFMQEKLDFTRRKADERKADADSWSARYHAQKWAMYHIRLLEEDGADFADLSRYCRQHWEYADIRKYYVTKCIEMENYDEAIAVLQECLQMDAGMPGLVRDFGNRLKEVYRISGRQEAYRQQLWQLVTKDRAGNLDDFRELKKLYSEEEWKKVREEVFQALPAQARVDCLYKEEGLYDRLLEYVLQAKGLYAAGQYQGILQERYPKQLLRKYTDELEDMVQRAADRRHYQEWAQYLRQMLSIEGGQEEVQKIVADWRVKYKNRPVMMEELKQF